MIVTEYHGDVEHIIGNGVAKELTHMTHGHEQWCGDCLRNLEMLGGGGQRGKNQDNCNSIINKIEKKKITKVLLDTLIISILCNSFFYQIFTKQLQCIRQCSIQCGFTSKRGRWNQCLCMGLGVWGGDNR